MGPGRRQQSKQELETLTGAHPRSAAQGGGQLTGANQVEESTYSRGQ